MDDMITVTAEINDSKLRELIEEIVGENLSGRDFADEIRDEVRSEVGDQISEVDFCDYMDARQVAREVVGYISAADIDDIGEVVQEAVEEALPEALDEVPEFKSLKLEIESLKEISEVQAATITELQLLTSELTTQMIKLKNLLRSV